MHGNISVFATAARSESVGVTVAVLSQEAPGTSLQLQVDDRVIPLGPAWTSYWTDEHKVWYAKRRISNLQPGTTVRIVVRGGAEGDALAECVADLLPARGGSIGLVFGSCFDGASGTAPEMADMHHRLVQQLRGRSVPVCNIWCGDQVYVDAPWQAGWKPSDARRVILDKYCHVWGLDPDRPSSLGDALRGSSNWFLPDDHEFWNGYPHPSLITLPVHTVTRVAAHAFNRISPAAPKYPHPYTQGRWGRAAGEAYCAFQTELAFSEFNETLYPPQLQSIELDHATIVMADTRWYRTIRRTGSRAAFMREDDLRALRSTLEQENRLVCLVLARPLIGCLPNRRRLRRGVEYGAEDYCRQYVALWRSLRVRADAGYATVIIAGDVHRHSIQTAFDGRLCQIVSSPLALIAALDERGVISKVTELRDGIKTKVRSLFHRWTGNSAGVRPPLYPVVDEHGEWTAEPGKELMGVGPHVSGIASAVIARHPSPEGQLELGYRGLFEGVREERLHLVWNGTWTDDARTDL